jgi:hypothetical protein
MSTTDFVLTADADFDDLPRTLRRERDVREREKREREKRERISEQRETAARRADDGAERHEPPLPRALRAERGETGLHAGRDADAADVRPDYPSATVRRLDIPFLHLTGFFLKAVIAAVPALILLGTVLWGMGQVLKILFPWLLQMQIFIQFPG